VEAAKGSLLLAEPFMQDPNFKQSVVFLCEKNEKGSIGFIMNRETGIFMADAVEDFPSVECMIYEGGPVEKDTIHFLTTKGDMLEDSIQITDNIYWGGNFDKLKFMLDTKQIEPNDVRFFLGYSGWEPGQIEFEMDEGSWITAAAHAETIFKEEPKLLWRTVLNGLGGNYKFIANLPDNPINN
jgi:putative transcriptional regulator